MVVVGAIVWSSSSSPEGPGPKGGKGNSGGGSVGSRGLGTNPTGGSAFASRTVAFTSERMSRFSALSTSNVHISTYEAL